MQDVIFDMSHLPQRANGTTLAPPVIFEIELLGNS